MGEDMAMKNEGTEEADADELAKDNCYVERNTLCNSQIGVEERKVTRLQVGRGK